MQTKEEMQLESFKSSKSLIRSWYLVVVMALSFGMGELSHFLVGTTTRLMAQDLHYGDQSCIRSSNVSAQQAANISCQSYADETT